MMRIRWLRSAADDLWAGHINGARVTGSSSFVVTNPVNASVVAHVADLGAKETEAAVRAASAASSGWAGTSPKDRGSLLSRWFDCLTSKKEELSSLITRENGKTLSDARKEVDYALEYIKWFGEEARRGCGGRHVSGPTASTHIITMQQPIGVCALIAPWNFPLAMLTRKVAAALAAGCTTIVKPPQQCPLTSLTAVLEAEEREIFPPGVLNIVPCSSPHELSRVVCADPEVRKVSFTGSTKVGRILMKQCSGTITKLSLELGGNAAFIAFEDCLENTNPSLDGLVQHLMASKLRGNGQTCICPNRIFIHREIFDAVLDKLKDAITSLKVGDGMQEGVDVGPLITKEAREKVEELERDAIAAGAKVEARSSPPSGQNLSPDCFYPPALLDCRDCKDSEMKLFREEIFGPLFALYSFDSEEEVLRRANSTEMGLANYIFTGDISRATRIAQGLQSGIVGLNTTAVSAVEAPFGGIKQSGFGREGGEEGLAEYQITKYVCLGRE